MQIGKYYFDLDNEPVIMGILNVTPDSFSDGGKFNSVDRALKHTAEMIRDGAKIIDVGGESTRPGYTKISDEEEIERTVPIIEAIKNNFDIAVSLDTYKGNVAKAGVKAGIDMINDIWGFKYDEEVAKSIAGTDVAACVMHNRPKAEYDNYVEDLLNDLKESVDIGRKNGVNDSQIVLDPGVGFGKTYEHNLQIINECDKVVNLGFPVLLGTSRKSVIGLTLDIPAPERSVGTCATTVIGYERGCRIFRVHDVIDNYQALLMAQAICKQR